MLLLQPLMFQLCTYNSFGIQEIIYIVDMFRDTLQQPVETPDNPFVAPVNIEVIQSFMQTVGYQGIVNKYNDYLSRRGISFLELGGTSS
ncbi:hypothetical protein Tco_1223245 [Tanacetum coccineum]